MKCCERCHYFTPIDDREGTHMGYCDWVKSAEAKLVPIPISVERLASVGIMVGRDEGQDCRGFTKRRTRT